MNKPHIYKKTIKATGISYIGQHCGKDPQYLGSGTEWKKALKLYLKDRAEDLIEEILEVVQTVEELDERERYWLNFYNVKDNPNYYNATNKPHGGNRVGCPHTEEAKELNRQAHLGKQAWNKGKPLPVEIVMKFHKAVRQFTRSGEFIREFISIKEASNFTGISSGDISAASTGYRKFHAKNFIWIKVSDFTEELLQYRVEQLKKPKQSGNPKAVQQIDIETDKVLYVFQSCAAAEQVLGLTDIASAARGRYKSKGGFKWKYI